MVQAWLLCLVGWREFSPATPSMVCWSWGWWETVLWASSCRLVLQPVAVVLGGGSSLVPCFNLLCKVFFERWGNQPSLGWVYLVTCPVCLSTLVAVL